MLLRSALYVVKSIIIRACKINLGHVCAIYKRLASVSKQTKCASSKHEFGLISSQPFPLLF